jgi:hypothetical protein
MPLFDRPPIDAISVSNTLFSSGTFRITGGSSVTVSSDASGAGISIDPNVDFGAWRNFEQQDALAVTNLTAFTKTPFYFGEQVEGDVKLGSIGFKLSAAHTNLSSTSNANSFSVHFGVYRKVNSTSASLMGSASDSFVHSTASSASYSNARIFALTSPGTVAAISMLTAGDYVFGMMFSATASNLINFSLFGAGGSAMSAAASAVLGVVRPGNNAFSSGTSQGFIPLNGRGSTTVNAMPANVVAADLVNQGSGASLPLRPWIHVRS